MKTEYFDRLLAAFFVGLFVGLMASAAKRKRIVELEVDRVGGATERRHEDSTESKTSYPRVLKTAT